MSSKKKRRLVKRTNSKPNTISLERIIEAAKQEATGSKTSAYVATTIAAGLFYTIISLIILALVPSQFLIIAWLSLSFLFALTFSPLRYASEELIRQLFPSTDYNSHELIKRLNTISYSSLTTNVLSTTFFQELESGLKVPESAFIFFKSKREHLIRSSDHFKNVQSLTHEEVILLKKHLIHRTEPLKLSFADPLKHIMKDYHIHIIVPLTNNDELVGILLLGSRFNQKHYTTKDLKVLTAIAPKIGFAIMNTFSYEAVSKRNTDLINELRAANEKFKSANHQLKHDDRLKDEFIYIATHELKNPVTAMKGYLSLIDEGSYGRIPEKLQSAINQIKISNQQLIGLLNNLLQIARSEAQRLELKVNPVAICQIIDAVIQDLKPLYDQKKLNITHTCANTAVTVMADKERLREIINNLVSNAIKYSGKGTISITHEIIQDHLVTHIQDEGVGISEKDQKKIFSRFFRVEEEAAKGIPGTGLGLFIVKQLIEKMSGRIWFKSELDKGSTFTISLPLARTYTLKSNE